MSDYEEVRRNPWPLRIFIVLAFLAVAGGSAAYLGLGMFKHKDTPAEIAIKTSYGDWQARMDKVLSTKHEIDKLYFDRKLLTASHQGTDPSTWTTDKAKLEKIDESIMDKSALFNAQAKNFNNLFAIDNRPFSTEASLPSGIPEEQRRVLREIPLIT